MHLRRSTKIMIFNNLPSVREILISFFIIWQFHQLCIIFSTYPCTYLFSPILFLCFFPSSPPLPLFSLLLCRFTNPPLVFKTILVQMHIGVPSPTRAWSSTWSDTHPAAVTIVNKFLARKTPTMSSLHLCPDIHWFELLAGPV